MPTVQREQHLSNSGFTVNGQVPADPQRDRWLTKERFVIDLEQRTITRPAQHVATITFRPDESGVARFAPHCRSCSLRSACTKSQAGRSVSINQHEAILQVARAEQTRFRSGSPLSGDRPLVERKIAHLVRRSWGGRRARTRGLRRVATDLDTRAGAIKLGTPCNTRTALRTHRMDPYRRLRARDRLQTRNSANQKWEFR